MRKNSNPLITTVIPTYKRPRNIGKAIESVLNQSFSDFLIYVCDNASGDETSEVVANYASKDARIKYFCHSENIQAIPNFNFGMQQVKTPFFTLLADDNTVLPDFFKDGIKALEENPEAILFAGQTVMINDKGKRLSSSLQDWQEGLVSTPDGLVNIWEKGLPTWESVIFRTEVLESTGFLDESFNPSTDQEYMMRIARKHPMLISKKPCAFFLRHEDSWGFNRDINQVVMSWTKLKDRYLYDEQLSNAVKKRINKAYKRIVGKSINDELFIHGVLKNDARVIDDAKRILKENKIISIKTFKALLITQLASRLNFFRSNVISFAQRYIQFKRSLKKLQNKL